MGEPVKYVAMSMGFIDGKMVKPGQTFTWAGKPPKWAKPASENPKAPAAKQLGGDTKPLDTQKAVKVKAGQAISD